MMLRSPMTSAFHDEKEHRDSAQFFRHFVRCSCAQDGSLRCGDNNCFHASIKFARPNRLNNCAVFPANPLSQSCDDRTNH
jgi:hypothetical protein